MGTLPSENPLTRHLGYDLLGPVVHRWLLALHQHMLFLDDGDTAFLYCARAGVRIKKLYQLFCQGTAVEQGPHADVFWISRLSVAKGTFDRAPVAAINSIAREYHNQPLREVVCGVMRHHPDRLKQLDLSGADLDAHGFNLPGWISVDNPVQKALRDYLSESSQAFEKYLHDVLGGKSRGVLIDSGWQGSSQSLLTHAYPELTWKGLYFGRILTESHDPRIVPDVIGLMFERDQYDPAVPESAFVEHRHIIECLLEPNGVSIEEVPAGPFKKTAEAMILTNEQEVPDDNEDALYLAVRQYLMDNADATISEIMSRHRSAMSELARVIVMPSRDEAHALYCKPRSADFGKSLMVPVIIDEANAKAEDCDARIQRSLWPQGQIALEYQGGIARDLQLRVSGLADNATYFDPASSDREIDADVMPQLADFTRPAVAIITRTKNRPILLERAALSVGRQTFQDFVWVVVNDGGDVLSVREIIEKSSIDRRRIRLVSNPVSLGMEAASNAGINACDSEFIVIHDDDDSWHPEFLEETVKFLTKGGGSRYGGVITHSTYISEEIKGNKIIEHDRHPYQDWVRNVQLAEMACGNFFPPIAFLYRRSIWDLVGGYNERLPVLGDWFFNMEFLLHADIGVIPKPLAFYHHRDRGDSRSGMYSNSVIGGVSKHEEFTAVLRNEFLRRHAGESNAALGVLLGYIATDFRSRMNSFSSRMESFSSRLDSMDSFAVGYQNSAVPGGQDDSSSADAADRFWVVAFINKAVADQRWNRRQIKALPGNANWEDIDLALQKLKCDIPPPDDFDESSYLANNVDVAQAIDRGEVASAYLHYVRFGRKEGRLRPRRIV